MAAVPFKVKAVYEYTSSHEDDLPFNIGQVITVTDDDDAEWYGGEYTDDSGVKREGIFPRNFVERFEPTAPPRPMRARKKELEPAAAAPPPPPPPPAVGPEQPVEEEPTDTVSEEVSEETPVAAPQVAPVEQPHSAQASSIPVANPPEITPVPAPAPIESKGVDAVSSSSVTPPSQPKSPVQARAGPPVSEKPSSNSFKDRIAAFNKSAAPPIAPFKPSGLGSGSTGFIKKPFVAPPPSRNAYVPPPRESPVTKVYRREEDPEIKETEAESLEIAEKARLVPNANTEAQDEGQPKPTTLKERIALLQKQQAEAAQRHADVVAKKEKPKRPPKKRFDNEGPQEGTATEAAAEAPPLERRDTAEVASKESMDEPRSARQSLNIRRQSIDPVENDGNEADMSGAGDTTEGQEGLPQRRDSDEKPKPLSRTATGIAPEEEITQEDEVEEEGVDVDPEIKRKEELRARMAKMSGGMGMAGMFGPPGLLSLGGGPPPKKPKPAIIERRPSEFSEGPTSPKMGAPPIPTMMALPGMGKQKPVGEETPEPELEEETAREEVTPIPTNNQTSPISDPISQITKNSPLVPGERPVPPPVPTESRPPPPPPPPAAIASPSVGSESDDEMSENTSKPLETSKGETSPTSRGPPPIPMASPSLPTSPRFSNDKRSSYIGEEMSATSPGLSPQQKKRNSRPPPPIPGVAPPAPTHGRPPPPPLPSAALSRASTTDGRITAPMKPGHLDNGEEGEAATEYEGDYDTDIGSSVPHKDALKAHAGEPDFGNSFSVRSPASEVLYTVPPPIPNSFVPRAGPPPIPMQAAPSSRTSADAPRAAPPPPPPPPPPSSKEAFNTYDDDYDPYNYNASHTPPVLSRKATLNDEVEERPHTPERMSYQALPSRSSMDRRAPPRAPPKKSLDILRPPVVRRSIDITRPSMETGFMANDIDLASHTKWWLSENTLPPVFQGRRDILPNYDESTSIENGRTFVTKVIFVLFQDYSQTVISVHFDPKDPSQTELDQRHEAPPRLLRQDELEEAYERFGRRLANSAMSKKDSIVGDGTPYALVYKLLRPLKEALLPIGSRAYGALVYANMANASTQLNDEIRPGDIISIRNAKFQGKHGPMHAKYSMEVGKPDHVAIVAEWDGTKKKVRAWEQGRESKKVKLESFKLDDLRSGEVKIWRVMPRTWVGWSPHG
ncbi:hypothetical protein F5Y19DRAFT_312291 [Xylariaceae sp. FL1651]|nr:hypothetical protein F5Y19DRAFT_312291 [Xylariaceae sp. FL1651]